MAGLPRLRIRPSEFSFALGLCGGDELRLRLLSCLLDLDSLPRVNIRSVGADQQRLGRKKMPSLCGHEIALVCCSLVESWSSQRIQSVCNPLSEHGIAEKSDENRYGGVL